MKSKAILFKCIAYVTILLCGCTVLVSCQIDEKDNPAKPVVINYHCATLSEGQQLLLGNSEYYNSLTQNDIDWRMRKTGATLDELKAMAKASVREFSEAEKTAIAKGVDYVKRRLEDMGVGSLPFPSEDIVFVKTTMEEEGYSAAYTHKTEIYVGEKLLKLAESNPSRFYETIVHEMFHCLTRNSPSFRSRMYSLIGFTVTGTDYVFSPAIGKMIITNPDVEHIDNYATFTIDGVKRKCVLIVLYTKTWAEASAEEGKDATFFKFNQSVLVPVDALDTYYPVSKVPDFWDVVGRNTDYVFAPEECLADNFAFAVVYGIDGREYKTPQLIADIIALLKEEYR